MGGGEEDEKVSHRDKMVDSVMGVRRPTFKRAYNATRLNSNYVYNSITMMMVSHVITALGHVITALGHVTTALSHVIIALGHVIIALGHVTIALGHVIIALGHVITAPGHVTTAPSHVVMVLSHVTTTVLHHVNSHYSLTRTIHLRSCVSLPQKLNGMFVCM